MQIEEYRPRTSEPGIRYVQFHFGKTLDTDELQFGYVMKFTQRTNEDDGLDETHIEWQYDGHECHGTFQPSTNTMVLNFFLKNSTVVITYNILSRDSVAVCIIDVTSDSVPTVQTGNMCRLDASLYQDHLAAIRVQRDKKKSSGE